MTTKTPHVHAELIKAWADGAAIQLLGEASGTWYNCIPSWEPRTQYRIKPEPKPDKVWEVVIKLHAAGFPYFVDPVWATLTRSKDCNVKLVFDGETEKLKSVEMIK